MSGDPVPVRTLNPGDRFRWCNVMFELVSLEETPSAIEMGAKSMLQVRYVHGDCDRVPARWEAGAGGLMPPTELVEPVPCFGPNADAQDCPAHSGDVRRGVTR